MNYYVLRWTLYPADLIAHRVYKRVYNAFRHQFVTVVACKLEKNVHSQ